MYFKTLALAATSVAVAASAQAATMFSDRVAFEGGTNVLIETFDDTVIPSNTPSFSFTDPMFTVTQTTPNAGVATNSFANSRNPEFASGNKRLGAADRPGNELIFDGFAGGTTAFGIDIFSDVAGILSIKIVTGLEEIMASFNVEAETGSTGLFFGITDASGILSVELDFPDVGSGRSFSIPTVDNVSLGTIAPIPVPAALPLLLAGLGGLGLMARRKA